MEKWVKEIGDVAESCGYEALYIPDRGGIPVVAISKLGFGPVSHINEIVWGCLKAHGDAVQWLSLWLNSCTHSMSQREKIDEKMV